MKEKSEKTKVFKYTQLVTEVLPIVYLVKKQNELL